MVKSKLALMGCVLLLLGQGLTSLVMRRPAQVINDATARAIRGGCWWYATGKSGCSTVQLGLTGYWHCPAATYVTIAYGVPGHYLTKTCLAGGTELGTACGKYYSFRNGCG